MSRFAAAVSAWTLRRRLERDRQSEARVLARAGAALRALGTLPTDARPDVVEAWRSAVDFEARRTGLEARLAASLEADRSDFAAARALGRALVIGRGVLERLRLREWQWRERRLEPAALADLGRKGLECPMASAAVPAPDRLELESVRARIQAAERSLAECVAPYGGEPLPRWLRVALDELLHVVGALREQVQRKFLLRLPALAAVLCAWWLARRYTASGLESTWHDLTGEGRAGLSPKTLERLRFWLPLCAGALTAYLASVVSRLVHKRYGTQRPDGTCERRTERGSAASRRA